MELSFIKKFETQMRLKLSQKGTAHQGDDAQLIKAFKYFDLNDSGFVDKQEFRKSLEKIGIWLDNKDQLDIIFNYYDVGRSGQINYLDFTNVLFNKKYVTNSLVPKSISMDNQILIKKQGNDVLERLRNKFNDRNNKSILGLARQFKIVDDDNNQKLDYNQFEKALKDYEISVNDTEIRQLFQYFDRNQIGYIDYDEFIVILRGPLSEFRKQLIEKVYQKLDPNNTGIVVSDNMMEFYNLDKHPEYINGRKTRQSLMRELMKSLEQYCETRSIPDGQITKEEFKDYYSFISCGIDNDQYFELLMNNCWRLEDRSDNLARHKYQEGTNIYKMSQAQDSIGHKQPFAINTNKTDYRPMSKNNRGHDHINTLMEQNSSLILEKIRDKIKSRGMSAPFNLCKMFRTVDQDNTRQLNLQEFNQCLEEFRLGLDNHDVNLIFGIFDQRRNGLINYDYFLRAIVGVMNQFRLQIVKQAFKRLDVQQNNFVLIKNIKLFYDHKNHPLVKQNKRQPEEILELFLDTIEVHYANLYGMNSQIKDKRISEDEFIDYYNNISFNIESDQFFELMLKNTWNLDNYQIKKQSIL